METIKSTAAQLYSPQQIFAAAVIGSPVAACWFFARNFRQLGQPLTARNWLIWGSGGSFLLLAILCMLPLSDKFPHYIIPIAYSFALREVARRIHGEAINQYVSNGGRLASWWLVIGISLLFLIGVFGLLLVILYPLL